MRAGGAVFLIAIALLLLYVGISDKYLCLSNFVGCLFTPNGETPPGTGTAGNGFTAGGSGGGITIGGGSGGISIGGGAGGIGGIINIPIPGLPGGIPAPFGPFDSNNPFSGPNGGFSAANVTQARGGR